MTDFLERFWLIFVHCKWIFSRFLVGFPLNFCVLVCWLAGCLVVCLACLLSSLLAAGSPYPRHGGGDGL